MIFLRYCDAARRSCLWEDPRSAPAISAADPSKGRARRNGIEAVSGQSWRTLFSDRDRVRPNAPILFAPRRARSADRRLIAGPPAGWRDADRGRRLKVGPRDRIHPVAASGTASRRRSKSRGRSLRPARLLMTIQAAIARRTRPLGIVTVSGVVQLWHVYGFAALFVSAAAFDPMRQAFVDAWPARAGMGAQSGIGFPAAPERPVAFAPRAGTGL